MNTCVVLFSGVRVMNYIGVSGCYTGVTVQSNSKLCRFYGSQRGCRFGDLCHFEHTDPNSVPLCRLGNECTFGNKCMFRHQDYMLCTNKDRKKFVQRLLIPNSSVSTPETVIFKPIRTPVPNPKPTRTLLYYTPQPIKDLIFEFKLEMERFELSEKINWKYQHQLELLLLEARNRGGINDREINDGLFLGDIEKEIKCKYGNWSTLNMHEYPLKFVTKVFYASSIKREELDLEDFSFRHGLACDIHQYATFGSEEWENVFPVLRHPEYSGDECVHIDVSEMPYRFEDGHKIVGDTLVLDLKVCKKPCFIPMTEHLLSIGHKSTDKSQAYEYSVYAHDDDDDDEYDDSDKSDNAPTSPPRKRRKITYYFNKI